WATIHHDPHAAAMRFAPGRYPEKVAKRISHGHRLREKSRQVKFPTNQPAAGAEGSSSSPMKGERPALPLLAAPVKHAARIFQKLDFAHLLQAELHFHARLDIGCPEAIDRPNDRRVERASIVDVRRGFDFEVVHFPID